MVSGPLREKGSVGVGFPQTDVIPKVLWLPRVLPRTRLHLGFLIALVLAVGVHLLFKHTTLGFSLRAVGKNPTAARFAGVNASRTMVTAMFLSGALAGLAGLVEVFGIHHRLLDGISPGYGFIAIIVALLGNRQPLQVVIAAILLASLDFGAHTMQRGTGTPVSLVVTIEYLTVILIVGTQVLRTHRLTPVENLMERVLR
jgi:simple sugar transport system permease protein